MEITENEREMLVRRKGRYRSNIVSSYPSIIDMVNASITKCEFIDTVRVVLDLKNTGTATVK
jgi:hypothetical protein